MKILDDFRMKIRTKKDGFTYATIVLGGEIELEVGRVSTETLRTMEMEWFHQWVDLMSKVIPKMISDTTGINDVVMKLRKAKD